MKDEDIFANWAERYGGAFNFVPDKPGSTFLQNELDDLRTLASEGVKFCHDLARSQSPPPVIQPEVYVGLVHNPEFTAFAFQERKREFIAVFTGTIEIIYSLCYRVMSHSATRPGVGCPGKEFPPEKIPFIPTNAEEWIERGRSNGDLRQPTPKPQDQVRQHYAHLLARVVLDYILLHEFGHLCAGHLSLDHEVSARGLVTQCSETGAYKLSPLTDQTLELNADSFAAGACLRTAIDRHLNPDEAVIPIWKPFYQDLRGAIETHCFAIYLFFRIFEIAQEPLADLENGTHPPARVRMACATAIMKSHLSDAGYDSLAECFISGLMQSVMQEVDITVDLLTILASKRYQATAHEQNRHNSQILSLQNHWSNVVYPRLLPHSRSGLINRL